MKIKFWGVRGSIPCPLSSEAVLAKIQAVVQRISPKDLKTAKSRERFVASLSQCISGTVGGNTSCVELRGGNADDEVFIFDAGTGIRELGKSLAKENIKKIHIFLSHFHWDHIQGFPFFDPIYNKNCEIHFYSPSPYMREILEMQMKAPVFPVDFNKGCMAKMFFHQMTPDEPSFLNGFVINSHQVNHPNNCFAYSFLEENGKKFIYATDSELKLEDYNEENLEFFKDCTVSIMDAQYTAIEAILKENWGHSSFCSVLDFASHMGIKTVYLFHHEPMYDDKTLFSLYETALWYNKSMLNCKQAVEVCLAMEHQTIEF